MGLLKVSLILRAGGFLGLEDGVWTAQHLMNIPIRIIKVMPINSTAHQYSVIHWATVISVSRLSKRFINLTKGPSASTARHFRNTSQ